MVKKMKQKKRIFIMSHAMELGGAERSLLGLLDVIDTSVYDVDLFLMRHEGELLEYIPTRINLLPEKASYTVLARPMKDTLLEGHIVLTLARVLGKISAKRYNWKHGYTDSGVELEYSHKYTVSLLPKIEESVEYDLAISFLTPHYYVAQKVKAKQKVAWIHTDYENVQVDRKSELKMWAAYDKIASISDAVTANFVNVFPELANKIVLIENILPQTLIKTQKKAFSIENEMPQKGIRLLSIGRYCAAKNFDNIPEICMKLVTLGLDVYWYIIGFGPDENLIKKKIESFHMEKRVILLGKKNNPYPYIDSCDWYVQPSRYEGKSVTVREAQMLGKPVIITNYATAHSQLDDGVDGIVVPLDNATCADAIAETIKEPKLRERLSVNCSSRDYSNSTEINRLYSLLDPKVERV